MFWWSRKCPKNKPHVDVEVGDSLFSSPQKSDGQPEVPKQDPNTPDTSATTKPAQKQKNKKCFLRLTKKRDKQETGTEAVSEDTHLPSSVPEKTVNTAEEFDEDDDVQEASTINESPVSNADEAGEKKKKSFWHRFSSLSRKTAKSPVEKVDLSDPTGQGVGLSSTAEGVGLGFTNLGQTYYFSSTLEDILEQGLLDQEIPKNWMNWSFHFLNELYSGFLGVGLRHFHSKSARKRNIMTDFERTAADHDTEFSDNSQHPTDINQQNETVENKKVEKEISSPPVSQPDVRNIFSRSRVGFGFPNLAQTCYMNAALQALLAQGPLVQDIYTQQKVWSSHPLKDLFRGFVEVGLCRLDNNNVAEKRSALTQFKRTVADLNAEFSDNHQKDAHEFLICILENLASVSNDLQALAASMGCNYTCPVSTHIAFKMLSTKTCKRCGHRSEREEDYLNLSLKVHNIFSVSVNWCLKKYLKKNELEYRCDCGNKFVQQSSFLTLPNVLILQLQRFRFTSKYKLEKVDSRVELSMNLEVKSGSSSGNETSHYSLVNVISHLGSKATFGHYVCDGATGSQREAGDKKDGWLTYDDVHVTEITAKSVCQKRLQTAYVLFYVKS